MSSRSVMAALFTGIPAHAGAPCLLILSVFEGRSFLSSFPLILSCPHFKHLILGRSLFLLEAF